MELFDWFKGFEKGIARLPKNQRFSRKDKWIATTLTRLAMTAGVNVFGLSGETTSKW